MSLLWGPVVAGTVGAVAGGAGFWALDTLVRRYGPPQHYARWPVILGGAALSSVAAAFATPVCGFIPVVLFAGMVLSEIVLSGGGDRSEPKT